MISVGTSVPLQVVVVVSSGVAFHLIFEYQAGDRGLLPSIRLGTKALSTNYDTGHTGLMPGVTVGIIDPIC